MQGSSWISLLKRIPAEQHDGLMLLTATGAEVVIQQILRMEDEFLLMRGRVAGSSDTGRAFFIPYDQINYLAYQRPIREEELRVIFGEQPAAPAARPEPAPPAPEPEAPREAAPEPVAAAPATPPPSPKPELKQAIPDRTALLERLRARTRGGDGKSPAEK